MFLAFGKDVVISISFGSEVVVVALVDLEEAYLFFII